MRVEDKIKELFDEPYEKVDVYLVIGNLPKEGPFLSAYFRVLGKGIHDVQFPIYRTECGMKDWYHVVSYDDNTLILKNGLVGYAISQTDLMRGFDTAAKLTWLGPDAFCNAWRAQYHAIERTKYPNVTNQITTLLNKVESVQREIDQYNSDANYYSSYSSQYSSQVNSLNSQITSANTKHRQLLAEQKEVSLAIDELQSQVKELATQSLEQYSNSQRGHILSKLWDKQDEQSIKVKKEIKKLGYDLSTISSMKIAMVNPDLWKFMVEEGVDFASALSKEESLLGIVIEFGKENYLTQVLDSGQDFSAHVAAMVMNNQAHNLKILFEHKPELAKTIYESIPIAQVAFLKMAYDALQVIIEADNDVLYQAGLQNKNLMQMLAEVKKPMENDFMKELVHKASGSNAKENDDNAFKTQEDITTQLGGDMGDLNKDLDEVSLGGETVDNEI